MEGATAGKQAACGVFQKECTIYHQFTVIEYRLCFYVNSQHPKQNIVLKNKVQGKSTKVIIVTVKTHFFLWFIVFMPAVPETLHSKQKQRSQSSVSLSVQKTKYNFTHS